MCYFHLQDLRISQAINQHETDGKQSFFKHKLFITKIKKNYFWIFSTCHLLHAGFLLGPFFDPEDGDKMVAKTSIDLQ
jgi:hypothetical protein